MISLFQLITLLKKKKNKKPGPFLYANPFPPNLVLGAIKRKRDGRSRTIKCYVITKIHFYQFTYRDSFQFANVCLNKLVKSNLFLYKEQIAQLKSLLNDLYYFSLS